MERAWLEERLEAGESFETIAREADMHASTVAYWARKYGLSSRHATRHAARGEPDEETLREMTADGCSTREMAEHLGCSQTTVRYWMKKHGLRPVRMRQPAIDGAAGDVEQLRYCPQHGTVTRHVRRLDGAYRCQPCRTAAVSERRRRTKRTLVDEAGGCCALCGYDRHAAVLQFHHLDPASKHFEISGLGATRALADVRAEAAKCVLLCPTCHAEVELGKHEGLVRFRSDPSPG